MMIGRSSMKNLAKTLYYSMSKKKLTQQWRKPIEQLKQEKQQNTPIPPDADHKKKVAMEFMAEKYGKPDYKYEDHAATRQNKKMFKKKGTQATQQQYGQQSLEQRQTPKTPSVNWLQLQQFPENKQLTEMVNEALNMSRLKYLPELKQLLQKIRQQFHSQGLEQTLNSLFKQNFTFIYDNIKQIGLDTVKLNTRLVHSIIFNLLQNEEFQKLSTLLTELKSVSYHLESKHEEFFEMMFWKQTSHDVKFEAGENGINISLDNKVFVQKLTIGNQYLQLINEHGKKKRSARRTNIVPLWLNNASKIVLRYRFAHNEFRTLLTQVLTHHQYLLPESFYESQKFSLLLSGFYFGHQDTLKVVLDVIQKNVTPKTVKLSVFYRNFTDHLMNFRVKNGKPAFEVDETLIEYYKKAFEQHHKFLAIACTIIASDAQYKELSEHYVKSYMQGFPNESLQSEDTKFVEEGILNNYNHTVDAEKHEKYLNRTIKTGASLLIKLKSAIKLGELQQAYNIFEQSVYKKVAIERLRKNIEFVLRKQLGFGYTNFMRVKEVNEFINGLEEQYLWSLYKKSQDVSVMVKKYLPEDKFSFWEERQNKQRFEEISKKLVTGQLEKVKQPQSDIDATGFSLEQYLETQFPQLKQLETQQYEKEKQIIKFTLNIEGILMMHKVHNDAILLEKLEQAQAQLGQENLELIDSYGLKDYNIQQWGWEHFEKRFLKMKQQRNIMRDERLDWSSYIRYVEKNKSLTNKHMIEEMLIKTPQLFKEAEALVKLTPQPIVDRLLLWGVYTNEPMAVYLAQKLAMQTGQQIPHELALLVSRMLSYKRPLSEEFIQRCKDCLKIVGKIDREFIYSFDKEYEHILMRKKFMTHVESKIHDPKIDNRDLEDLITFTPRQYLFQQQNKIYQQSIANRAQQTI